MTTKITNANITNTGVSAGSYTNTNLTVNAQGQITAASNGTGGGGTPGGSDTQVQFNDAGSFGGDAGLTYNKTTDTLTTSIVVHGAGTVSAPSITTTGDTNTGVFFPAADTAAITTGGTERMRIDSSGNVGINTGSTLSKQFVVNGGTGAGFTDTLQVNAGAAASDSGPGISFNINYGAYSTWSAWQTGVIRSAANNASASFQGYLAFYTNNGGSSSDISEKMRINADGTIKTGSTISVGGATPSTSGAGITFPATQSASTNANTLDDYEEGTFTPAYNTSNSNMTVTDNGTGTYTKIGRVVHVYMRFLVSAISSAGTGDLRITGLPFTQASGSPVGVVSVIYESNFATNTFPTAGRIDQGKTYIDLYKRSDSDARSALNVSNVAADLAANSGYDWYYACYYV